MRRKDKLVNGEVYHVFNKSIAGYTIFNNDVEYLRMQNLLLYYQIKDTTRSFTQFIEANKIEHDDFSYEFSPFFKKGKKIIQLICYCIMPTHIHIGLKQLQDDGISIFMGNVLNSYSRYFNIKHKRKGPLWQGRFRNALIANDEQLLHLTRYIHLNPVTAYLVDRPEQWFFSSYEEFTNNTEKLNKLCRYEDILDIHSKEYKKFVEGAISYQRELAQSKHLLFDDEG